MTLEDKPPQRSLLFVTGTRADYGKLEPLAIACRDAGFKITFFITGMHMMARYGETRLEVKRFQGAEFFEFVNQRAGDPLDFVLAKTVMGFSDFVHEHRPDLVIIHGDRVEAMAVSIVCAMRYLRSAHIEGGEISGTIDESIRHCNTKLCSSHFVSSKSAGKRVLALGEHPDRLFVIGSPELDVHLRPSGVSIDEVINRYGIKNRDYGIAILHPVTSESDSMREQAQAFFQALIDSKKYFVVILPNNDPGSDDIMSCIDSLPKDRFNIIPSMRFQYFSELLKNASMIVGNSSVGVREAPFVGTPSLVFGSRQNQRSQQILAQTDAAQCHADIPQFIDACWGKRLAPEHQFGHGGASHMFLQTLLNETFWQLPAQKNFHETAIT
jgi:UDP-N-acetylglucosamine 2-epimerase (hydrolysing)